MVHQDSPLGLLEMDTLTIMATTMVTTITTIAEITQATVDLEETITMGPRTDLVHRHEAELLEIEEIK